MTDTIKDKTVTVVNPAVYFILFATMYFTYYTCLGHDFVQWDDFSYVVNNSAAHGFTSENIQQAFSKIFVSNYAPVHIMSYMFDYEVWGMAPRGYILTNLITHFFNGILFFHICNVIITSRTGAAVAAFIFLFHPVQVESVAWISERKNVLSMFFFLASFYSFIHYRLAENKRHLLIIASITLYSLALLTKIAAVILPCALLLFDSRFCHATHMNIRSRFREYAPYIIISLCLVAVAVITQKQDQSGVFAGYYAGSGYKTFLTMLTVLPQYLINIFWPQFLSIIYSPPIKEAFDREVIFSVILIILIIAEGICLYRRKSQLLFWYGLFFIAFLPVSQIIPLLTVMQDRYCYFPLLGLSGFVGVLARNCTLQRSDNNFNVLLILIFIISMSMLPVLSKTRSQIWNNSITLFETTAKAGIGNRYSVANNFVEHKLASAYFFEAEALSNTGDTDRAVDYCLKALSVDPLHYEALVKIGALSLAKGKYTTAYYYLAKLTTNYPRSHIGFYNLGQYYYRVGNLNKSQEYYQLALKLNPSYKFAKQGLAAISANRGDYQSAVTIYREIVLSDHENAEDYYVLAGFEAATGNVDASYHYLEDSIDIGFKDTRAIKSNPLLATVINKPKFRQLLARISE